MELAKESVSLFPLPLQLRTSESSVLKANPLQVLKFLFSTSFVACSVFHKSSRHSAAIALQFQQTLLQ